MNGTGSFKIPKKYTKDGERTKQIDVFMKDEDSAIVVECKAAKEKGKKKYFSPIIEEISGMRSGISQTIKEHYENKDLSIGWVIATKNYHWTEDDKKFAKKKGVAVFTDVEIEYFNDLFKQVGTSAKYQLLAKVFPNKKIKSMSLEVPAIKYSNAKSKFYSFGIEPEKLLKLSYVAHRSSTMDSNVEQYQRMFKKDKLNKIRNFITQEKGIFPNSIIVNFNTSKTLKFKSIQEDKNKNSQLGLLTLPPEYGSAWIIDGQHRLYGYTDCLEAKTAILPVIAFEKLEHDKQSSMFIDINTKQTSVNRNLLEDLAAELFWSSDEYLHWLPALEAKASKQLGSLIESPLYSKVDNKHITLTTLTTALRKQKLVGSIKNKTFFPGPFYDAREPEKENTLEKTKDILVGFFNIFKEAAPEHWEEDKKTGYLCTNQGLSALLFLLKDSIDYLKLKGCFGNKEIHEYNAKKIIDIVKPYVYHVAKSFQNIDMDSKKGYRSELGVAGQRNVADYFLKIIHDADNDFYPDRVKKIKENLDEEAVEEVNGIIHSIERKIAMDITKKMKSEYGERWPYEAGLSRDSQNQASARRIQEKGVGDIYNYFNILNWKTLISKNWEICKENYTINELIPETPTGPATTKTKIIEWIDRLNNLRNDVAHASKMRSPSKEDLIFVRTVRDGLNF